MFRIGILLELGLILLLCSRNDYTTDCWSVFRQEVCLLEQDSNGDLERNLNKTSLEARTLCNSCLLTPSICREPVSSAKNINLCKSFTNSHDDVNQSVWRVSTRMRGFVARSTVRPNTNYQKRRDARTVPRKSRVRTLQQTRPLLMDWRTGAKVATGRKASPTKGRGVQTPLSVKRAARRWGWTSCQQRIQQSARRVCLNGRGQDGSKTVITS
jgi:hypothetical protein